ncbi:MAG: TolC family protein [Spirochaetaceae bacterium]|jgi:outer membrane protein TolC|nr:TolC family protein [Spirochaetaceae bacterium]
MMLKQEWRNMKKNLFLSVLMLAGIDLFAQTISLEQARLMALANSRSLARYSLAIQSSILEEKSQLYTMLPSVSADYNASMFYLNRDWGFVNPTDTFGAGFNFAVTQKIFEGGKSFIQKALCEIATESVRKEALAEFFNVLDAADNAYYAVLEAAASLEAAESSLQTANLSLAIAEVRQSGGIINQGDYLKALAEKESRENTRNQARRNLALCYSKFRNLTGLTQTVELEQINFSAHERLIVLFAGITDEEADVLYANLLKILLKTNPSLARALLNNQRAEKNLSLAKRDFAPTLSATLFSTALSYSVTNGFGSTASGGITLRGSIPLDFWVLNNRIEKSKNAQISAALDYANTENSLETELQSALLNALAQAGTIVSSRRALEYAEKHFEYVMERYRLSQSSVSDLGEASSLLISNRNNLIRAQYGFLQSLSKLRSLCAVDDEKKLVAILTGSGED